MNKIKKKLKKLDQQNKLLVNKVKNHKNQKLMNKLLLKYKKFGEDIKLDKY